MKVLIIQTAFIGDVILTTPLIEKLKEQMPQCSIDFLLRKGNESIIENHPKINRILIFDKKKNKYKNLFDLIRTIRNEKYDFVINVQRFLTTGFITAFSNAKIKIGFDKNPFSFTFDHSIKHNISGIKNEIHEVSRNLSLLQPICNNDFTKPKLYPSEADYLYVPDKEFVCIAPTSIWFTKQFPEYKWIELCDKLPNNLNVFLIGAKQDFNTCENIMRQSLNTNITNFTGKLSFLQSAALISKAKITFTNDSAPLHLASAMNAPVAAVFCSTVPEFGFGPLSDRSYIFQNEEHLPCRPCNLHGKKSCPESHFKCSDIDVDKILKIPELLDLN